MKKFIDAATLKSFLSNLLPLFKLKPETEIFPKQTQLTPDLESGGVRPGQFVNLPYFNKTERRALNTDGTEFTFEQFIPLVESNLVNPDQLNAITDGIDKQIYEGTDEEFRDGPPCLAHLSKIMKDPKFDVETDSCIIIMSLLSSSMRTHGNKKLKMRPSNILKNTTPMHGMINY